VAEEAIVKPRRGLPQENTAAAHEPETHELQPHESHEPDPHEPEP
jgi:hypothetical protein